MTNHVISQEDGERTTEADKFHAHCVTALEFIAKQNKILDREIGERVAKRKANDEKAAALEIVRSKCYLMVNDWVEPSDMSI